MCFYSGEPNSDLNVPWNLEKELPAKVADRKELREGIRGYCKNHAKSEATGSLRVRKLFSPTTQIFGSIPVLQLILFAGLDFVASYEAMLQQ